MDTKVRLRKCVSCGEMKDKKDLIRIVRYSDGHINIDTTFKENGRGAYICRDTDCILNAKKKNAFNRSLKCYVDAGIYDELLREAQV